MAGCEHYEQLINALLDEGLTAEQEADLREHVRGCPSCRRLLTAVTAATRVLREEELAQPPAELAEGVMARVTAAAEGTSPSRPMAAPEPIRPRHSRSRRRSPWVRWGTAACLVLAAGGAVFAFRGIRSGGAKSAAPQMAAIDGLANGAVYQVSGEDAEAGARAADAAIPAPAEAPENEDAALSGMGSTADSAMIAADEAVPEADQDSGAVLPSPSPTPAAPVIIRDAARAEAGTVPPENREALLALLEGGRPAGGTAADWDMLFTADIDGLTYTFATDENARVLVWWDSLGTGPIRSPGTLDDLRALMIFAEPVLPE